MDVKYKRKFNLYPSIYEKNNIDIGVSQSELNDEVLKKIKECANCLNKKATLDNENGEHRESNVEKLKEDKQEDK